MGTRVDYACFLQVFIFGIGTIGFYSLGFFTS